MTLRQGVVALNLVPLPASVSPLPDLNHPLGHRALNGNRKVKGGEAKELTTLIFVMHEFLLRASVYGQ